MRVRITLLSILVTIVLDPGLGRADEGVSRTCKFAHGPRAGQTQYLPGGPAIPIGKPCHDGAGSSGEAVPDSGRVSDTVEGMSNTCRFKNGPRAGQTQHYPGIPPIPLGSPCDDGAGSSGEAVPDSGRVSVTGEGMSNTCRFDKGPRAGQSQHYPGIPPIPLGSPCDDGAGSSGEAVPDGGRVSDTGEGMSNTCRFNKGPRAGQTQYFPGIPPIPLGSPCDDNAGSSGEAVPDGGRVSDTGEGMSNTCHFEKGPRAGQSQYFPGLPPIPLGSPCDDGAGSSGEAVPDLGRVSATGEGMSTTCRFNKGPRAGQTQHLTKAPPVPIGSPCNDGAGSSGVAISNPARAPQQR